MTGWAADERPPTPPQGTALGVRRRPFPLRLVFAIGAGVFLVGALAPPLSTSARRVEALEALQFVLLALGVPVLAVLSAPWRWLRLAAVPAGDADPEGVAVLERPLLADRLSADRRRHLEVHRSAAYLILDIALLVVWRLPVAVDALARHRWLAGVEALSLVAGGTGLWLELVESPPFSPRLAPPKRIAVAALAMWTIWVAAYLVGLSHASVYRTYPHVPGRDLSVSADQAFTTGVLWFTSLCAFVPVVFSNLFVWLRNDEDPDDALHRLVRNRRRGAGGPSCPEP